MGALYDEAPKALPETIYGQPLRHVPAISPRTLDALLTM